MPLPRWHHRETRKTGEKEPSSGRAKKIDRPGQALVYSANRTGKPIQHVHSIYVSTFAILFLGTPHDGGTNKVKLASATRRMIGAVVSSKVVDTNGQLLDALGRGSEALQNITDMFVPLMKHFRVFFFWEQEKTDLGFTMDYVRLFPSDHNQTDNPLLLPSRTRKKQEKMIEKEKNKRARTKEEEQREKKERKTKENPALFSPQS